MDSDTGGIWDHAVSGRKSVINWLAPASLLKALQHVTVTQCYWLAEHICEQRQASYRKQVAQQECKLLIWLRLSARLVNRDKDLIATTDTHHRPVRVHTQRPGKGLQAKQSESLRAQNSAIQKPDQNRNNTSHSLYNHPYALNHIQLVNIWQYYEVNIFIVLAIIYHRFHAET